MNTGTIRKGWALTTALVMTMVIGVAQSDTSRIAALLDSGARYVLREGNEKTDLDSADFLFNQALVLSRSVRSDKWINKTLEWRGDSYLEGNDLSRGEACFMEVIGYYRRTRDRRREAETWSRLGECIYNLKPDFSAEKAKCYEEARRLYHLIGDTLRELESYKAEADAHLWVPNPDLAEKELLAAIQGFKAIHAGRLHFTYDLLRAASRLKGDIVKEVQYSTQMVQSLDSSNREDDSCIVGRLYGEAAQTFAQAGMWDRSLLYARKGSMFAIRCSDYYHGCIRSVIGGLLHKDSAREALDILAAAIRRQPLVFASDRALASLARGNCYLVLKDGKKAEEEYMSVKRYLDSAEKGRSDRRDRQFLIELNLALGKYYFGTRRYQTADGYARKLHFNASDLVRLDVRVNVERFRSQVDSIMGRYQESLTHFAAYQLLNDSLSGVQKAIQMQELQVKYAIDQKDKDLRIQAADIGLLTKQTQLQQAQAAKSRIFRNMMIAGLFVLLLLVGLIYNRYRLKQQKNLELECQQKEIFDKNRQLERLLAENEWLLREVHHRVKNNLQVIISLLKSQSSFLHDKAALAAVVESEHRVYAMSLIHQKLYKSNNVSSIDMPEYIGDLVEYLKYSFQGSGKLWFDLHVAPVKLDVQQAVPVGLILNEIITNSFKYAFPCTGEDRITVRLSATEDGGLSLIIADNGRGLPKDFDQEQNQSFGMLLIAGLTEDLEGSLEIESQQGTVFHIRFKPADLKSASNGGARESAYFSK